MTSSSLPRIDGFDVLAKIGEGGIGAVYLATKRDAARTRVAIKVLQSGVAIREKVLLRFAREGRVGQSLHHPHVVTVLGSGEWEGTRYIVMEFVDGTPLTRWLPTLRGDEAPPPRIAAEALRERLRIVASVADALDFVHAHGIVHRDVKTGNVLVRRDGHAFLTDFGLAKNVEVDSTLTSTGTFMGTPAYMPPEQILGRWDDVDHRSDVYSLGVTLYEVVTGRLPFDGVTYEALREQIVEREPPRLDGRAPGAPPGLEAVILRAMEKRREDRYASAGALRDDVLRLVEGKRPRPGELSLRVRREGRRIVRQRVKIGAAIGALAIATLVVTLLALKGESRDARANGHVVQGFSALDRGELREALAEFQKVVDLKPESPDGHLCRAIAFSDFSQTALWKAEVAKAVECGLPTEPSRIGGAFEWYCFGLYRRMSGADGEAESALEKAIARDPRLLRAYYALYEVRKRLGKRAEAREALLSYKKALPGINPRFDLALALLDEDDGNYEEAVERLESLRRSESSEVLRQLRIERQLGRLHLRLGRWDDAERELKQAVDQYPEDAPSIANLALLLERQRLRDPAAKLAVKSLGLDEGLETPRRILVRSALRQGTRSESRRWLEDSTASLDAATRKGVVDRFEAECEYVEGMRLQNEGSLEAARHHFERCLELDDDHFQATLLLMSNAWCSGELSQALRSIDRVLWLFERDGSLDPRDRISAMVAQFDVSAKLGLEHRLRDAARFLDEHPPSAFVDAANFVEALAKCPVTAYRDVGRAKELIRLQNLRQQALAAGRPDCVKMLDEVEAMSTSD